MIRWHLFKTFFVTSATNLQSGCRSIIHRPDFISLDFCCQCQNKKSCADEKNPKHIDVFYCDVGNKLKEMSSYYLKLCFNGNWNTSRSKVIIE